MRMRTSFLSLALVVLLLPASTMSTGCLATTLQTAPPTLSPAAQQAFKAHQTQQVLDLIRDVAVDANAQKKSDGAPLLSDATTRQLVKMHATAITMIHASTEGWPAVVRQSLTEIKDHLMPSEKGIIGTYLDLGLATLKGLL